MCNFRGVEDKKKGTVTVNEFAGEALIVSKHCQLNIILLCHRKALYEFLRTNAGLYCSYAFPELGINAGNLSCLKDEGSFKLCVEWQGFRFAKRASIKLIPPMNGMESVRAVMSQEDSRRFRIF